MIIRNLLKKWVLIINNWTEIYAGKFVNAMNLTIRSQKKKKGKKMTYGSYLIRILQMHSASLTLIQSFFDRLVVTRIHWGTVIISRAATKL